jgi:hypothetical protein
MVYMIFFQCSVPLKAEQSGTKTEHYRNTQEVNVLLLPIYSCLTLPKEINNQ